MILQFTYSELSKRHKSHLILEERLCLTSLLVYFLLSTSCVDAIVPLGVSDSSALGLNHNQVILFFISGAF